MVSVSCQKEENQNIALTDTGEALVFRLDGGAANVALAGTRLYHSLKDPLGSCGPRRAKSVATQPPIADEITPFLAIFDHASGFALQNAAAAMWALTTNVKNRVELTSHDEIRMLYLLLKYGGSDKKQSAFKLLTVRSEVVVKLLRSDNHEPRELALAALETSLAHNEAIMAAFVAAGLIEPLLALLPSYEAVRDFGERAQNVLARMTKNEDYMTAIIAAGGLTTITSKSHLYGPQIEWAKTLVRKLGDLYAPTGHLQKKMKTDHES